MATVAVSKNKRSQVLFRTTPPLQQKIIVAYDHQYELDDMLYTAVIVDETIEIDVSSAEIDIALEGEISIVYDDTDLNVEVC
jgi:hypothetical protein